VALPPRILNITVPQVGHLPLMALRPFFMTSSTALTISFLALHLTQYPSGIDFLSAPTLHARSGDKNSLEIGIPQSNPEKKSRKLPESQLVANGARGSLRKLAFRLLPAGRKADIGGKSVALPVSDLSNRLDTRFQRRGLIIKFVSALAKDREF
jgi:hypothetical protein